MRTIEISDQDYAKARQAADARGETVEQFVSASITLLVAEQDEPVRLTQEQVEIVERGLKEYADGRYFTMEEVQEKHAVLKAAWRREHGL